MKRIKYNYLSCQINKGTEENPILENVLLPKDIPWNEANEAIAKAEACNGEYTIEDDGQPEVYTPTTEERLAALEAAQLEMLGVMVDG